MAALRRPVVLRSNKNNKYLQYIHDPGEVDGFLQFSGDDAVSKYTKFEIEKAKCGEGLFHVRCCYNNLYWARLSSDQNWIVARAAKPEEDRYLPSCTLFEQDHVDGGSGDHRTRIRFRHVQLGNYACLREVDPPPYRSCLFAGLESPDKDLGDVVTVIDWESLFPILPKHVAFRGDNNKYLSAQWIEGNPYLQFASDNIKDPKVRHEVITTSDGCVRIKSNYLEKFWRRSPTNWICPDHSDDTGNENPDTVFLPVQAGVNVVTLRNLGNNILCKSRTAKGITDCLSAEGPTITTEACLEFHYL